MKFDFMSLTEEDKKNSLPQVIHVLTTLLLDFNAFALIPIYLQIMLGFKSIFAKMNPV